MCFVSLPLVVRELVPVLEEIGLEQEQAGKSLGANAWQRLWHLTLPSVRWALAYGVVLSLARSLGEFGAVRVVAGNVLGSTQTMPLLLAAQRYNDLDENGPCAISFVMVALAIVCIVVVAILRPKERNEVVDRGNPGAEHIQAIRRLRRPRRRERRRPQRSTDGSARAQRRRQVHPVADHRGT